MALNTQLSQNDYTLLDMRLEKAELYFIIMFLIECIFKIIAHGFVLHKNAYLRDGWNVLDFLIVVIGIITYILSTLQNNSPVDVKSLRVFRVLRPLRLLTSIPSLQIVLNSIVKAFRPLTNIAILIFFLMIIYSIIGMTLFMGRLHATCYNNVTAEMMVNPIPCNVDSMNNGYNCSGLNPLPEGQSWKCKDFTNNNSVQVWPGPNTGITNFDNMGFAMLTVFQITTKDSWNDILYWVNNSMGSAWPWIYFFSLIFLVSFFVLNLILGVLNGEYNKASLNLRDKNYYLEEKRLKEENKAYIGYKAWIEYGDIVEESIFPYIHSDFIKNSQNHNAIFKHSEHLDKIRKKWSELYEFFIIVQSMLRRLIKNKFFFIIILVMVFLNTVIMATEFTNQPNWLTKVQDIANIVFICFFTLELLIKMIALGIREYFSKLFNIYDFIVVLCSIIELCLINANHINNVGIAVLRCVRLLRIFKLTRYWDQIRSLNKGIMRSFKAILSLIILLVIFIVIFALLGMQFFGGRFYFNYGTRSTFDTFQNSVFSIFQIITGDSWSLIMFDGINSYKDIKGGGGFALYFIIMYIIGNYVILNVFVAIAVSSLRGEEFDKSVENEIVSVEDSLKEMFVQNSDEKNLPEIPDHLVIVNGCPMLPPITNNDILSVNKIRHKNKKRVNFEQRLRINFITEKDLTAEISPPVVDVTYNDLYAEEDDGEDKNIEEPPIPKIIPTVNDFKKLKALRYQMPPGSSCFILRDTNNFRIFCLKLVNHSLFKNVIFLCIILSSIMLAFEDPVNESSRRNAVLRIYDYIFTAVFSLEIIFKMFSYGIILHKGAFLRNAFNWIDLIVVFVGLIDNILSSLTISKKLSAVKALRVFRILRPFRTINRLKGLKHVLRCVIISFKSIGKIMIVTFLLVFMFSVVGVFKWKGTFNSCTDNSRVTALSCRGYFISYSTDKKFIAIVKPRVWNNNFFNYDNVFNGILTLYVVATFSGWSSILYKSIDATKENQGPQRNNNPAAFIFYVIFIVTVAFFMINTFVGMVIVTFQEERNADYLKDKLDKNKHQCIDFALKARPVIRYIPSSHFRYKVWRFVCSNIFENTILFLIIFNTICLAINYYNKPQNLNDALHYINITLTVLFTIECFLKMYAFNFRNYFDDPLNVFDILVISGSIVDAGFILLQLPSEAVRINLFRLFRVLRLVRLCNRVKSFQRLLWTFFKSLQTLPYVVLLIVLTLFIYGVMGMQFFGNIGTDNAGSEINRNNNFQTFLNSLLLLFRCITGGSWHLIMQSCTYSNLSRCSNSTSICGSAVSYVYFTSFVMLCSLVILNLFIAIIIENFDYLTRDRSVLGLHHLQDFITVWSQYDSEGSGRMHHLDVVNMLSNIDPPLGFGKMCTQIKAFRNLIRLNIPLQTDGTILFNSTLFALVRKGLKIKYSELVYEKQNANKDNDELRIIVKKYWKNTNSLLLDQIIAPNINQSVTIGKFYSIFIIKDWLKKCILKKIDIKINKHSKTIPKEKYNVKIIEDAQTKNDAEVYDNKRPTLLIQNKNSKSSNVVWSIIENIFTIPEEDSEKH